MGEPTTKPDPAIGAVVLPDGTTAYGRGRRETCALDPPDFGLYLGRSTVRRVRPTWPFEWIDWPDFRTPRDGPAAAVAITRAYALARDGRRIEIVCGGGTGRTGTVVACMAVLAGLPAVDALTWTRHNYRRRAVETPGQRRWILWFAHHIA